MRCLGSVRRNDVVLFGSLDLGLEPAPGSIGRFDGFQPATPIWRPDARCDVFTDRNRSYFVCGRDAERTWTQVAYSIDPGNRLSLCNQRPLVPLVIAITQHRKHPTDASASWLFCVGDCRLSFRRHHRFLESAIQGRTCGDLPSGFMQHRMVAAVDGCIGLGSLVACYHRLSCLLFGHELPLAIRRTDPRRTQRLARRTQDSGKTPIVVYRSDECVTGPRRRFFRIAVSIRSRGTEFPIPIGQCDHGGGFCDRIDCKVRKPPGVGHSDASLRLSSGTRLCDRVVLACSTHRNTLGIADRCDFAPAGSDGLFVWTRIDQMARWQIGVGTSELDRKPLGRRSSDRRRCVYGIF